MKLFFGLIVIIITVCILPVRIFAASLSFIESPSPGQTVDSELVFKISLSINTSDATPYYLRGTFYKSGTSNYCGFTWNGFSWYSGPYSSNEGWKNFQKIVTKDNRWEGEVKAKIDSSDSGCKESGEYKFKIARFTESGSSSFDSQGELSFAFVIPTPTPTVTPTPSPTPTSAATPTPKTSKTLTPQPTEKKNSASTPTTILIAKNSITQNSTISAVDRDILGSADAVFSPTPAIHTIENKSTKKNSKLFPKILLSTGVLVLIIGCGILAYLKYKKERTEDL